MNQTIRTVVLLGFTIAPLGACTTKGDGENAPPSKAVERGPAPEPHTTAGQVARDFVQERDRVVEQMNVRLAELDARIAKLKDELAARTAERRSEATSAVTDRIAKLEERRTVVRDQLEQAKGATEDRWRQAKDKADENLKSLEDSYEEVARELRR